MPGVVRTVVGYSGGSLKNPTYKSIKDSTECVLVEFNPKMISYEEILIEMMRQHSPFHPSFSRQYRSVIFYRDEYEKEIANEVIASVSASLKGGKVYTSVEPITTFYRAEEYHQNWNKKQLNGCSMF